MNCSKLIHPTAIVHHKAKIADDISVGAHSVIDEYVSIGSNTVIGNNVTITGDTSIGKNNRIYHSSSIGEDPQDKKYDAEKTKLIIGDNNTIREFCTINRGTAQDKGVTFIGNNNWIMAYVHIAHDCHIGNECIFANATNIAGHVEVNDFAILGGFTGIHQFCKIGAHIITAVGTVVYKDIPPFIIVSGNGNNTKPNGINIEGLKRRDFSASSIAAIKKAYKIIYRDGNTINEALIQLKKFDEHKDEVNLFVDFINKSKRGLVR